MDAGSGPGSGRRAPASVLRILLAIGGKIPVTPRPPSGLAADTVKGLTLKFR